MMLPRIAFLVVITAVASKGAWGATRPIADDVLYSPQLTLEAAKVISSMHAGHIVAFCDCYNIRY